MPNADHVSTPLLCRKYVITFASRILSDPSGESGNCFVDVAHSPGENLLESCDCHWDQHKLGELAHIEAAGARSVLISVINQACEIFASGPRQPRLLKRHSALPPLRSNVQIAQSVGAEQPFVTDCDQEIRLYSAEVQRAGSERLTSIDYQGRANLPDSLSNPFQVDLTAIGPVTLRRGNDRRFFIDCIFQGFCPRSVTGAPHRDDAASSCACQLTPRVHIGGEFLIKENDGLCR